MKYFTILLVIAAVTLTDAKKQKSKKRKIKSNSKARELLLSDVSYYDCSGQENGNKVHPWDCTRYIKCNNNHSFDISCPFCTLNEKKCPTGWKMFNLKTLTCGYANEVECKVSGSPPKKHPREADAEEDDYGRTTRRSSYSPRNGTDYTTQRTSVGTKDPRCKNGTNCEYQPIPCDCSSFFQCCHGPCEKHKCPPTLFFNNETKQCDSPERANCNLNSTMCCACGYFEISKCSSKYLFKDCNHTVSHYDGPEHCNKEELECENGLVWNTRLEPMGACDFRKNVDECNEGSGEGSEHDEEVANDEKETSDSDYIRVHK